MQKEGDLMLQIVVKNVYEHNKSIAVEMKSSETVLDLKEKLEKQLESTPMPRHQRLIFGGKICENSQTLAQILKRVRGIYKYASCFLLF